MDELYDKAEVSISNGQYKEDMQAFWYSNSIRLPSTYHQKVAKSRGDPIEIRLGRFLRRLKVNFRFGIVLEQHLEDMQAF